MFENVGYGEILVLLVAGLFILGPERLPEAAAWLARTIKQVREFATGARDQLKQELGPDFEEFRKPMAELREPLEQLRGLRNHDPRRMVTRALFDDPPATNGMNGSNGMHGANGYPAPRAEPAPGVRPLSAGERPPIDPDAT